MKSHEYPKAAQLDLMLEVQHLLDDHEPEKALDLLLPGNRSDPRIRNARAVCLMQLGRYDEAMSEISPLVLGGSPLSCRADAPTVCRANFVAIIALRGDPFQALSLLHDIPEQAHPAVQQLRDGLRAWRRSVAFWRWPLMVLGVYPSTPLRLDFTPGWLLLSDANASQNEAAPAAFTGMR